MKRFIQGQRVRVLPAVSPFMGPAGDIAGKTGTVCRVRISDNGAWVRIDGGLPPELRSFPADDPDGRGADIILYPHDCELEWVEVRP